MINKKYKKGYIVVFLICAVLMAVGAKYDWMITDTLYNPKNIFGVIFEAFSWLPIYAYLPVWGATMMIRNKNNMSTFLIGTGLLIATNSMFIYSALSSMADRGFVHRANPYLSGMIGGIIAAVMFLLMRNLKRETVRKIQAVCSFAFVYMFSYLGSIFVLKVIFGRDRYEDIITGGAYKFADWFKPVFFSDGSSFPSGHTAAAMGIIILLILPFVFEFFRGKQLPLFIGCYVYVALTAFSRLIMGRHFLSDTAMAVIVMTIVFIVLTPFFERIYRKELLKD